MAYIDDLTALLASAAQATDIAYVGRPGDPDPDRQMLLRELAAALARLLPAGSAAAPALAFEGDPDTGIYRVGANQVGFAAGGSLRAFVASLGLRVASGGTLQLPNGSVGAPALTFTDDTDTGLYLNADGVVSVTAGGTRAAAFGGGTPFRVDVSGTLYEAWHSQNVQVISNANGVAIRFPIGYQVCFTRLNMGARNFAGAGTYTNPYRTNVQDWTFPAAFSGAPRVQATCDTTDTDAVDRAMVATLGSVSTTVAQNVQAVAVTDSASNNTILINLEAWGPWS